MSEHTKEDYERLERTSTGIARIADRLTKENESLQSDKAALEARVRELESGIHELFGEFTPEHLDEISRSRVGRSLKALLNGEEQHGD